MSERPAAWPEGEAGKAKLEALINAANKASIYHHGTLSLPPTGKRDEPPPDCRLPEEVIARSRARIAACASPLHDCTLGVDGLLFAALLELTEKLYERFRQVESEYSNCNGGGI